MYNVSDAYKAKMLDQIQTHRLVGLLDDTYSFTEADVIGVSYKNQCSQKNVALGSVNIGVLKLTLLVDLLDRGDYYGKKIVLYDGLKIEEESGEDVFEDVPVGVFYIAEAIRTAAGIVITAYDVLSKTDKNLTIDQTSGTLYYFCKYIESETGASFGMTQEECEALPNGLEVLSPYEDNDMTTFRDLMSAIAQMVGGFAYADRLGTWKLRSFDNVSVIRIPKARRMSGTEISDFDSYYDFVSYVDAQTKIVKVIGEGDGLVMKLGNQPFLQYGTPDAITRRVENIVAVVKQMVYTPFKASMLPAFIALDLGDVIELEDDYSGETSSGAVMLAQWTYNKAYKVQCYGDNPNLRDAQSRTDKDISGIISQTVQNEVTYYNFANLEPIQFGSDQEVTIAQLYFTAAQQTTVKIMHEFIMDQLRDLSLQGSYEIRYYLDEERVNYSPYESLSPLIITTDVPTPEEESGGGTEPVRADIEPVESTITRDFFYVLRDIQPGIRHSWEVRILTHGIEETTIDVNHAHITLEGQRLYGEEYFDGYVEAKDMLELLPVGGLGLVAMSEGTGADSPKVIVNNVIINQANDNINLMNIAGMDMISLDDAVTILMEYVALSTEDDEDFMTEDDQIITVQGI